MKPAVATRSRTLRFAITPMIDIVFLLIIFFLVATHFVKSETQTPVDLPEASLATLEEEVRPQRVIVTVSPVGEYSIAGRVVSRAELEAILQPADAREPQAEEREVRIRGDLATPYEFVKPILLACARAGIRDVSFSVMPTSQ